ncbi:MAG: hypothetical protein HY301_21590 [Verrucomicrobia bacterium]|nr:hypothetical protein [Verrucomicrobiota bacterium]
MRTKSMIGIAVAVLTLVGLGAALAAQPRPHLPPQEPAHRPPPNHAPTLPPPPRGQFGEPLPGLTAQQLADFAAGREEFENVETPDTGLGPIFNNTSCAACHTTPAVGGASAIFVTRFGRVVNGVFDPLADKGGSLLQQFAIDPLVQEVVPPEANVVAHRITTPLFGLGLIEAIPDDAIRDNARHFKPDGVRGRVSTLTDVTTGQTRVGRFGWKAQQATLLAFAGDAYVNEMGITSRFFPTENAPNGKTNLLAIFDAFADPEDEVDPVTNKGDIDTAADFMRFLAPPPRVPRTRSADAGEMVFHQVGCAVCHTPMMQSGPSPVAALDRKPVWLYSDLLLHDMGALGDGIAQGTATMREMKTAPLWGLRARPVYLHDGRAPTVDAAIRAHDGEAGRSRENYHRLGPVQRQQLLEFLNSI